MNTEFNIINKPKDGMFDLCDIMSQARYVADDIMHLYPNINKMNFLKGLLNSTYFRPLFERGDYLKLMRTQGLLGFTRNYIRDNIENLKLENDSSNIIEHFNIDAKILCGVIKYVTAIIWYRGITQEELFKYIDLEKILNIVKVHGFKYKVIDPLKSESLLERVLYDGVRLIDCPDYKNEEVKRLIKEYYEKDCFIEIRNLITRIYNLQDGLIDILFYDYINELPGVLCFMRKHYINSKKDIDTLDLKKVDLIIFDKYIDTSTLDKDLYSIIKATKEYKIPLLIKDDFIQTVVTLVNENKENIKTEYISLSNLK